MPSNFANFNDKGPKGPSNKSIAKQLADANKGKEKLTPQQRTNSIADFSAAMKEAAEKLLPEQVVLFQKKVALEAMRRIIFRTPVDTGRARGNWQLSINAPTASEVPEVLWRTQLEAATRLMNSIAPFSICYICNNVPYIVYLEEGSSQRQAPQGMVAITFVEMRAIFK